MPFLPPTQQCQSTEGKEHWSSEHWRQPYVPIYGFKFRYAFQPQPAITAAAKLLWLHSRKLNIVQALEETSLHERNHMRFLWDGCITHCTAWHYSDSIPQHTHTTAVWPFVQDYPGRPVPEETFTHSHPSWSTNILYQLPPYSIVLVQLTCFSTTCLQVVFVSVSQNTR